MIKGIYYFNEFVFFYLFGEMMINGMDSSLLTSLALILYINSAGGVFSYQNDSETRCAMALYVALLNFFMNILFYFCSDCFSVNNFSGHVGIILQNFHEKIVQSLE